MANENLGASFSIDITQLRAGLVQANRLIRESESQFREAAAGMDDWTKSQTGLEARISSLTDQIDIQKKKVNALVAEKERIIREMEAEGKSNEEVERAVDGLNKEIEKEGKTLDRLQGSLNKSEKSLEDLGDAGEDAANDFGTVDIALGNLVANGISALIDGCKNAIGTLLGLAEETQHTRTQMAKLETAFTTAGLGADDAAETYRTLYGVLGDEDKATEAAAHLSLLAKNEQDLANWTNIATGVYAQFGDSLPIEGLTEAANETAKTGSLTGVLADALNWAGVNEEDFQKSLDNCATEQERQALITETLNGLYDEQADKYRELNGDIIAANEAQADFEEKQAALGEKMQPVSTAIKEGFTGILDAVLKLTEGVDMEAFTAKISEAFDYFIQEVIPAVKDGLTWIVDNKDAVIAGLVGIGAAFAAFKVVTLIQSVKKAMEGMTIAQAALNFVMSMNPIGLLIAAIVGLVAAFVVAWHKVDGFKEFWIGVWEVVKNAFVVAWEAISAFFTETIPALFENVKAWFSNLFTTIGEKLTNGINAVKEWGSNLVQNGKNAASNFITNVVSWISQLPTRIKTWFDNAISKVVEFASDMAQKGLEGAKNLFNNIVDTIKELPSKMISIGKSIAEGIWDGISNSLSWIKGKIKGWVGDVVDFCKKILGINSPSKVMADEIGRWMAEGVGVGFTHNINGVSGDMANALVKTVPNIASAANGANGAVASGQSVNIYQTNNFSQAHSRAEIYKAKQQTVAAVRMMAGGMAYA